MAALDRYAEPDLIEAARGGDFAVREHAQARLIKQYRPLVNSIIAKLKVPPGAVEDAEQAGCVAILRALAGFKPEKGAFGSYVYLFIVGEVASAAFPNPCRAETETAVVLHEPVVTFDPEAGVPVIPMVEVGFEVIEAEMPPVLVTAVSEFVDSLPENRREVLRLVIGDGLTQAEVARTRGVSPAAVCQSIRRTLDQGRQTLDQYRTLVAA
jgi:RNA polymerase sigma factor (sigma-70 family)